MWTVATVMLAAAWSLAAITPPDEAAEAAFPVAVTPGEPAVGRAFAVTVTAPRISEGVTGTSVQQSGARWSAPGIWLVVEIEAAARASDDGALLNRADLQVGGRTFSPSDRPRSMHRVALVTDVPQAGTLAYELPADILGDPGAEAAMLRLALDFDVRLDSVLELPLDLTSLPLEQDAVVRAPAWSGS